MSSPPPATVAYLRPWQQFFNPSSLTFPISISESTSRLTQNLNFFIPNYAYLIFFIFLLTLLINHPFYIVIFFFIYTAWERLIFTHNDDEPFTLFNYNIDPKIVLGFLYVITLVAIFWTHVWFRIFLALIVGLPIVLFHAILHAPEGNSEDSPNGSLINVADSPSGEYGTF